MNTYKIITTKGYSNYILCSLTPDKFLAEYLNFDYDEFNKKKRVIPSWDKSCGVVNHVELFYCNDRQYQVKEKLN